MINSSIINVMKESLKIKQLTEGGLKIQKKKLIPKAGFKIVKIDPYLEQYRHDLELRMNRYFEVKKTLLGENGCFKDFANGHKYFGFHRSVDGWYYREWAPAADGLYLIGDFNGWDRTAHPLERKEGGVWEIFLPGRDALQHQSWCIFQS
jgi:1,4-alpha-glucan branching enzyme